MPPAMLAMAAAAGAGAPWLVAIAPVAVAVTAVPLALIWKFESVISNQVLPAVMPVPIAASTRIRALAVATFGIVTVAAPLFGALASNVVKL